MSMGDRWLLVGLLVALLGVLLHVREWRAERAEMRRIRGWDHE